jgi:hypothetical protein
VCSIFQTIERGLAIQASKLSLSALTSMWVKLFLRENIAAGLIGGRTNTYVSKQINYD